MSTFTQILYQIVFSTKHRQRTLNINNRSQLFQYITGILKNKKCHLYHMNGVEDHIHIITHLHPTIALSSLVKDIKVSSSKYIKDKKLFQHFFGWQTGYAAFTYSIDAKDTLIYYVKNQESHHKKLSYKDELVSLLEEHKIPYDNKYLE